MDLVQIARKARGLSPERAAKLMPYEFSGSSWRQYEAGYRGTARKPVRAKPEVLAAMARAVGVTADRLEERSPEAAAVLREMELQEAQQAPAADDVLRSAPAHVRRMIDAALEDVDPQDRAEVLRQMAADYEAVTARRARQGAAGQRPRQTG
ncbi:helix-turn-helix domain-containing protein [Streptomyces canus]|uniref:helix-turn-helix domain-containing protein n=1 Tax=Streptomyces canus TaxID=58343 RepID=UPI003CE82427